MRIGIVGAGASGMAAAIFASASDGTDILLFEKQPRCGKKLLMTGNGRCNLTNANMAPEFYHGEDAVFSQRVLQKFGAGETLAFFSSLGLFCVTEPSGRVYPFSDSANSVLDVLRFALDRENVRLIPDDEILTASFARDKFTLISRRGARYNCEKLIVAAGSPAGGRAVGSASGYALLESFGHTRTKLMPSLSRIAVTGADTRPLKGVRADAGLSLYSGGVCLAETAGEVQFVENGVSGPAAFELSRAAARLANGALYLDLCRQKTREEIVSFVLRRAQSLPRLLAADLLTGLLQNRLGRVVTNRCGIAPVTPCAVIGCAEAERVADEIKRFKLDVAGVPSLDEAQVCAGGMATDGFDPETLESRLCPGLYAAGEVLDVDGDCGGYNLQWAWASGRAAGLCAAGGRP